MPSVISAHEARLNASRSKDADNAYAAVSAALQHASSRVGAASERGHTSTMFTVLPEFHGFNGVHAVQVAREVRHALQRKGYHVTAKSATDLYISWAAADNKKRSKSCKVAEVSEVDPEDAWRFGR